NIADEAAVSEALGKQSFDAVVDWRAYTPDDIERDIRLFRDRTKQFVFISSASAYQKPVGHYLITESTPLANPYWQYSRDKIACEDRLTREYREKGFPITIVRPNYTYGVTTIPAGFMSWSHPWTLVDRMRKGKKIIVHGDGTAVFTLTHNTDFAKAFVGLMGNMRAIGHPFHITSDFIAAFSPADRGGIVGDKANNTIFDNSKIKTFVPGFTATVPFSEGI